MGLRSRQPRTNESKIEASSSGPLFWRWKGPIKGFCLFYFLTCSSLRAPNSSQRPIVHFSSNIKNIFQTRKPQPSAPRCSLSRFRNHPSYYSLYYPATDRANRKPGSSPRPSFQANSRVIPKVHPVSRCLDRPAQQTIPAYLFLRSDVGHLAASNWGHSSVVCHLPIDAIAVFRAATSTIVPLRGCCYLTQTARVDYRAVWWDCAPTITPSQPHCLPGLNSAGDSIRPAGRC